MPSTKPVESALDLLGRRWALRLVWELRRSTLAFSELRKRTGISPSVLSARLGDLTRRMRPTSIGFAVELTTEEWATVAIEHQHRFGGAQDN